LSRGWPPSGIDTSTAEAGLHHAGQVKQGAPHDPRLGDRDARKAVDLTGQAFGRPSRLGEDVAKAAPVVIGRPGLVDRAIGAVSQHQRGHPGRHDQGDGQRLRPDPADVTYQLAVERPHQLRSLGDLRAALVSTRLTRPSPK